MRQERSSQNLVLVLLAVAVLAMSVGFATYSQNLSINGTATFKKASWDVHFDSTTFAEDANNSVAISPAPTHSFSPASKPTQLDYTVTLEKPGDVYQFTVDVINEGTIDAKLTQISLTNDQSSAAYISHSVTYDGVTYTDATNANINKVLAGNNGTETVTVRVEYVLPANEADLPTAADVTAHLGVTLNYVDNSV